MNNTTKNKLLDTDYSMVVTGGEGVGKRMRRVRGSNTRGQRSLDVRW